MKFPFAPFLPTSRREMDALGWDELDIIIITGDTGSVKASILAGEMNGGECVVDKMIIQNVHPQLIPALSGTAQVVKGDAIGAMEFYSITSAIKAADVAAKAAQISALCACDLEAIAGITPLSGIFLTILSIIRVQA